LGIGNLCFLGKGTLSQLQGLGGEMKRRIIPKQDENPIRRDKLNKNGKFIVSDKMNQFPVQSFDRVIDIVKWAEEAEKKTGDHYRLSEQNVYKILKNTSHKRWAIERNSGQVERVGYAWISEFLQNNRAQGMVQQKCTLKLSETLNKKKK